LSSGHENLDLRLHDLALNTDAVVERVEKVDAGDLVSDRLADLGFVPGETVRVVALGPIGADPLVVRLGFTRFALRRAEAARVRVRAQEAAR